MNIFVDSAAWISIAIKSDQHHDEAVELLRDLQKGTVSLITSDYILDEVLTLVRMRSTHQDAKQMGTSILKSPIVHFERISEAVWEKAWKIFQRYNGKIWSFTDCTSFALMDHLRISTAFTFDNDFEQYGKKIVPVLK